MMTVSVTVKPATIVVCWVHAARSAAFVSIFCIAIGVEEFQALIEPVPLNCAKKQILAPRFVFCGYPRTITAL